MSVRISFLKAHPEQARQRDQLLSDHATLDPDGGIWVLDQNITFKSANEAAKICVGGNINAWTAWKNKAGKTMDEVLRHDG